MASQLVLVMLPQEVVFWLLKINCCLKGKQCVVCWIKMCSSYTVVLVMASVLNTLKSSSLEDFRHSQDAQPKKLLRYRQFQNLNL